MKVALVFVLGLLVGMMWEMQVQIRIERRAAADAKAWAATVEEEAAAWLERAQQEKGKAEGRPE